MRNTVNRHIVSSGLILGCALLTTAAYVHATDQPATSSPEPAAHQPIAVVLRPTPKSESFTDAAALPSTASAEYNGASAQAGQTRNNPVDKSEEKIAVTVWAVADTPDERRLSQDFAAAGLRATTFIREWQGRIADTIRIHLPLCESRIAVDRERAAEALRLAELLASKDADRAALEELLELFENFQRWSDALVEDNRNGELGRYYMSPTGLNDDPIFQKTAECSRFLAPMLAAGRLTEDRSCQ